jgi:extracellular factor (EF) 3-hydroxypalmitic acid methyl ester biosynthesis protein
MVSFRNSQGESVRATIMNLQRKSLVMEVYNPYSIIQTSEVLSELTVRLGMRSVYAGKAVVISLVNTGLTAIVSTTLIDDWRDLSNATVMPGLVRGQAMTFVNDWTKRFQIRHDYQIAVNGTRAFLSDISRWVEQVDLSTSLPKENGGLREDIFHELATPFIEKIKSYFDDLEEEALQVDAELASTHRAFAQTALHPLMLRAPFVFRTYTKPLGYAGDYQMVNQMMDDPRQGPSTYFQIVNAAFLQAAAAVAHRNRIDILVKYLTRLADAARVAGRPFRILNIGCGPAIEVQRFLETYPNPEVLSFELVDFSEETLAWTRTKLSAITSRLGKDVSIRYVHDSVHQLLKRRAEFSSTNAREFDAVYCAGLFDYLSNKVCSRLISHFVERTRPGGTLLVTNVHACNPDRMFVMEHLLEWYLIYRDETSIESLLPMRVGNRKIYADETGVNVFAEATVD